MKLLRRQRLVALLLGLALLAAACGDDDGGDDAGGEAAPPVSDVGPIAVGSANFAESTIIASMYAQVLEQAGYDVSSEFEIGARDVYYRALENGEVDLSPEFVGSLLQFLGGEPTGDTEESVTRLSEQLPDELVALEPAPGQSTNVFVVTQETAEEHGLEAVSDLAGMGDELVLGGPPECPERPFCIQGLRDVYGVDFSGNFRPLDAGGTLTRQALESGEIDVALLFSTDANIAENDWVVLEDDQQLQQAENVIPVIREEAVTDEVRSLLNEVSALIDDDTYQELVGRVYLQNEDPETVAEDFLTENGLLE